MFRHRYSTEACVARKTVPSGALAGCEALGTKVSRVLTGRQRNRERMLRLPASGGQGPGSRGMANIYESLINVVIENKPKVLGSSLGQPNPERVHRLGPKGKGSSIGAPNSPIADVELSAERRGLTHAVRVLARNVVSPQVFLALGPKGRTQRQVERGKASREGRRWTCG